MVRTIFMMKMNDWKRKFSILTTPVRTIIKTYIPNTYHYNENGCLFAQDNEILSIHGVYPQHYYEYTLDENCHKTNRLWKELEVNGDTTFKKNIYINGAEGRVKIDSQYAFFNDNWTLLYITNAFLIIMRQAG